MRELQNENANEWVNFVALIQWTHITLARSPVEYELSWNITRPQRKKRKISPAMPSKHCIAHQIAQWSPPISPIDVFRTGKTISSTPRRGSWRSGCLWCRDISRSTSQRNSLAYSVSSSLQLSQPQSSQTNIMSYCGQHQVPERNLSSCYKLVPPIILDVIVPEMVADELKTISRNLSNRWLVPRVHRPPQLQLCIRHIVTERDVVHPRLERGVEKLEPTVCSITNIEN